MCGIRVTLTLLLVGQSALGQGMVERIAQTARECVQKWVGELPVDIRWFSEPRHLQPYMGVPELRCLSDSTLLQQGRFVFEVWSQGQWAGRFVLPAVVRVYAPEVRLRKAVEAGEPVTEVEQTFRWMTLAEYWQRVPPEEVAYLRARRRLAAGQVLLRTDCLQRAGVRRGELVTLYAQVGAVQVRTIAQALEDGAPGSWIRVRREGAGRILRARVVDEKTVVVEQGLLQP